MRIVLDTNVFLADIFLKSEKIRLLVEFAKRTESPIVVPEVVLQEIEGHLERLVARQIATLSDVSELLEACTRTRPAFGNIPAPANAARSYLKRLKKQYGLRDRQLLKVKPEYLADLVNRATKRIKPFNDRGGEFRDGLIWLAMLDMGAGAKEPVDVSFISANTRDFAQDGGLHPILDDEAKAANVRIQYFPTVDAFLKAHAERIAFITTDFIEAAVDTKEVEREVLDGHWRSFERHLKGWFGRRHSSATENVELLSIDLQLDDFYVYPAGDDGWVVIVYYTGEGEVEGEVYQFSEDRPWSSTRRPFAYGFDSVYEYPSIQAQVELRIKDKKLVDWNVIEVELDAF